MTVLEATLPSVSRDVEDLLAAVRDDGHLFPVIRVGVPLVEEFASIQYGNKPFP